MLYSGKNKNSPLLSVEYSADEQKMELPKKVFVTCILKSIDTVMCLQKLQKGNFFKKSTGKSEKSKLLADEHSKKGAKNVDLDHNRSGCFDSFDQHCEKLQEVTD